MSSAERGREAQRIFDCAQALEALGDDRELLTEMAELFLSDTVSVIEEVRRCVEVGDATGLQQSAHRLKGGASNFYASGTVDAALRLERMGHENDIGESAQALEDLLREIDLLTVELEKLTVA